MMLQLVMSCFGVFWDFVVPSGPGICTACIAHTIGGYGAVGKSATGQLRGASELIASES
jgi:hypothetical protein